MRTVLITGGAGFIGSNLAERLLADQDTRVRIFDNFSRLGVAHNLQWLRSLPTSGRLEIVEGDVRNAAAVQEASKDANEIYHLAAQVAVTTSIKDPVVDFDVNARGTLNVLEAARLSRRNPFVLFTSTNKVYGSLAQVPVTLQGNGYRAVEPGFQGVCEDEQLDFHLPYGCSKGAADQYVRDYARIYKIPTVVFRMSCIAGPRQFGNEDQGWVAHFLYSVLANRHITVYGNGCQVRDVLHVHDLVNAMLAASRHREVCEGEVYNLGGGLQRSISVLDMLHAIEAKTSMPLHLRYSKVRAGDQPLYISDTGKFERDTGWRAHRSLDETLEVIHEFWRNNSARIAPALTGVREPVMVEEEVA